MRIGLHTCILYMYMYVQRNLGIYAISRIRYVVSGSHKCVPNSETLKMRNSITQSRDCVEHVDILEIALCTQYRIDQG